MLRVISDEEELRSRTRSFKKLQPNCLFNLGGKRNFIAIREASADTWEVVELIKENRELITSGRAPKITRLRFQEMSCLNIFDDDEAERFLNFRASQEAARRSSPTTVISGEHKKDGPLDPLAAHKK